MNKLKRIALGICAVALALSMTACGDKEPAGGSSSQAGGASSQAGSSSSQTSSPSTPSATGKFSSLDDFVRSETMQGQIRTQQENLKGSGMSVEIVAEGNKLVYNFTVEDEAMAAALDAASLKSSLDSQASTFKAVAQSLKAAVEVENPVVVVRYLDNTGKEIYAQEFAS